MQDCDVSSPVAILPLSLYFFALGLGPVVGGPLSETIGRYPVYIGAIILGSLAWDGRGYISPFLPSRVSSNILSVKRWNATDFRGSVYEARHWMGVEFTRLYRRCALARALVCLPGRQKTESSIAEA